MNHPIERPFEGMIIAPATSADIPEIIDLMMRQGRRLHLCDPRLYRRMYRQSEVVVRQGIQSGEPSLVVRDRQGRVRGSATPALWELSKRSTLHAFLTPRNGIARHITLPDPQEEDASGVVETLLTALDAFWRKEETTGELVRWPSHESWLDPILCVRGFVLDSMCALRKAMEPPPYLRSGATSVCIRQACAEDEETLVDLFRDELRVHAACVPCARVSPAAIEGFRQRLRHLWKGVDLEGGVPLVLVAEQEQEVVAMAETSLLLVTPDDEPGWTPPGRYGCIENLCVRERMRGQGIGQHLVHAVYETFAGFPLDLEGWVLWYNPDNRQAAQFWSALGFVPLWTTYQRLHHTAGSGYENASPMQGEITGTN